MRILAESISLFCKPFNSLLYPKSSWFTEILSDLHQHTSSLNATSHPLLFCTKQVRENIRHQRRDYWLSSLSASENYSDTENTMFSNIRKHKNVSLNSLSFFSFLLKMGEIQLFSLAKHFFYCLPLVPNKMIQFVLGYCVSVIIIK